METTRILTKNGVENTNIDGARDNNFNAGGRSGIVKGVLNEGTFTAQGNELVFDTCELRISGHRVVIEEPSRISLSGTPYSAERFQYIAKITNIDGEISFELITTLIHELEQDDILNGNGVYELEIGRFTHDTSGNITDVVRTADVITGGIGSGGSGDFSVGNVTTQTLDAGLNAEVDVEYNTETGKVDFSFGIPRGEKGESGVGIGKPGTGTNAEKFNKYQTNTASGASSHAEGEFTTASGDSSHAEGYENTASGDFSHAEGTSTTAGGECSHAEGNSAIANGVCSHAEGLATKATGQYQHVQGKYNIEDTENKYAHIVGNGNSVTERSNAHTLDWSGNAWYAGKVSGGTITSPAPVENANDYVTKKYFDSHISNPNLLINPDFSINQRGQTSYTGTGYGVDRWKGYQLNVMVCTPRDGYGVTLSAPTESTGTGAIYRQPFEASQLPKLAGRTVTISFKVSANRGTSNIYVRTMANGSGVGDTPNINSGMAGVVSKTITLPSSLTSLEIVFRKGAGTLDVDIDWAKLEIGSTTTEFIPPLIAEELLKCQRYYEQTPVKSVIKYARSTGQFYDGYIPYKVTKRVAPTVKLYSNDGTVDTLYGSTEATNKEVTTGWQTTYGFLALSGTNSLTVGSRYEGYFTADAEIY